ncbi:MAG: hypothetical protein NZ899_01270 [Thermoguttaceae bacterium]|nr:hypothetical protein [Thermoguttaceae bacterium]MDW8077522.1 DNA polymerase ligase N-terminal domain-containing protein [Thermoguttaceae bacterium]
MPRFVILEHTTAGGVHWDFMLEDGPALRTWSLEQPPEPGRPISAHQLPPHRLVYLEYEGPISGGRGSVRAWDKGTFESPTGLQGESICLRVEGSRLIGTVRLETKNPAEGKWVFFWEGFQPPAESK